MILNDICEFIIDCEHKTAPIQETGYPSIRTPNIGKGNLILDNVNRVSKETYSEWTKRGKPRSGDLIIAREAPVGNVAIIPENLEVCLGQRTVLVRPNTKKVDAAYLCYLLLGNELQAQIINQASGATVAHLNMKDIRGLKISHLPPLPTQQKIASILSAYDDLIENNNQRIQLLEEMAEEIYKEWFVRLRFPATAETPGYQEAVFVDKNGNKVKRGTAGALPEGWKVRKAEELFDINIGKTPPRKEPKWFSEDERDVYWVSIKDINASNIYIIHTSEKITHNGLDKFNMKIAPKNTVLLSFKLTIGKVAITTNTMLTNEAIAHFNIREKSVNTTFTYWYLRLFEYGNLGNTSSIGTAINSKIVKAMPFLLPSQKILKKFENVVAPFMQNIQVLVEKNQLLQETRDLLLPRLISGKLSVENMELEPEHTLAMAAEPGETYKSVKHQME